MCDYVYKSKGRENDKCPYSKSVEVQTEDGKFCVFHAPIGERKSKFFLHAFERIITSGECKKYIREVLCLDFEGFIFPDIPKEYLNLIFNEHTAINLRFSLFTGELNFSGSENKRKTIKSKITFYGTKYKESCFFKYINFEEDVNFSNVKFMKSVSFNNSSFLKNCVFSSKTRFKGSASFIKTIFNNVSFCNSCFYKDVVFREAEFGIKNRTSNTEIEFMGVKFLSKQDSVNFFKAKFFSKVNFLALYTRSVIGFIKTEFNDDVEFSYAHFESHVNFEKAIFEGQANFYNGPVFLNKAHFENTTFKSRADFTGAKFLYKAFFNWATFEGDVHIPDAKLLDVKFISTNFQGQLIIKDAFIGKVDFEGAYFGIKPYINRLNPAQKNVEIRNLITNSEIEFVSGYKTDIDSKEESYSLLMCSCSSENRLIIQAPLEELTVNKCTFKGILIIKPINENCDYLRLMANDSNFLGDTLICKVCVRELKDCIVGNRVIFNDVDLRRAEFYGTTDLRQIDFQYINKWPRYNRSHLIGSLRKQEGLYDETKKLGISPPIDQDLFDIPVKAPKPKRECKTNEKEQERREKLEIISEMYRAVAASYELRDRFGSAGPFKVGEFDLRKYMNQRSGIERFLLRLYRFLSSYGESVYKPLVWMLFTIGFPIFLYQAGGNCWSQAIKTSLASCFSFGSGIVDGLNIWLCILSYLQKLLTYTFIVQFLFALRRKVKR